MPAAVAIPLITSAIGAGAGIYGATKSSSSAKKAADLQTQAANHAADLETQAAQQQLDFAKQQSDLSQRNYLDTRQFNRQVYTDQQARLAPYRAFGQGAIAQLGQPIPRNPA